MDHISRIATKIQEKCPDKQIIIWDDMMREIDVNILKGMPVRVVYDDISILKGTAFMMLCMEI